jgi:hypothetical protein
MIKLVDILKEINEGKQVGVLYHFTFLRFLLEIIQTNTLKANPTVGKSYSETINCISLTRTPYKLFYIAQDAEAVLVIDGDKLSNRYKISPHFDWASDDEEDEMEERICGKDITNLDQYLIKVILFENNDEIESLLKEKDIPYEIKES